MTGEGPAPDDRAARAAIADADPAFEVLRTNFLRRSQEQLDVAAELLGKVAAGTASADALAGVMRVFHRFAGLAGNFGLPRAGALGKEGELVCIQVSARDGRPTEAELAELQRLLAQVREEMGGPAETSAAAESSPDRPITALVVSADPEVRASLGQLLAGDGLTVVEAHSQAEALRYVGETAVEAVITDAVLPDGPGYALVEKLRSMPDGEMLPIVVLSANAEFADKVEALACGADACFEKPVDWKALMRRIHHLLDRVAPEPYRVLSVEDDPDQAAIIKRVLESGGHQVRICADPADFDSALRQFQPDIVLMDIVLPGITGYDLVRYLRQEERHVTLPVLFLTTEGQLQSRFRSARVGGDDHLVKPVQPSLLLAAVTARVERARFLKSLLERDGLTRLLTHSAFASRADAARADKERRPHVEHAYVMIDIDLFKSVNDRFGHPVGDRVLASLSTLLRRRLRQTETIGRYGGEEFGVLFEGLPRSEVVRLVNRVREDFGALKHDAPGHPPFAATFSAGVAMLGVGMTVDAWKKNADDALYEAKHAGRNRVMVAGEAAPAPAPA